jgi:hypothetical protein
VGTSLGGPEECKCPELVAAGIIPDTLNQLAVMVQMVNPGAVIDKISGEIKAILGQFGVESTHQSERPKPKPVARFMEEKTSKTKKWRRVRLPAVKM